MTEGATTGTMARPIQLSCRISNPFSTHGTTCQCLINFMSKELYVRHIQRASLLLDTNRKTLPTRVGSLVEDVPKSVQYILEQPDYCDLNVVQDNQNVVDSFVMDRTLPAEGRLWCIVNFLNHLRAEADKQIPPLVVDMELVPTDV